MTDKPKLKKDGTPKKKPGPRAGKGKRVRSSLDRHADRCALCKHEDKEEIEKRYLEGFAIAETCEEFGLEYFTFHRHVKAFNLDIKRDRSTLTKCRNIIDRTSLKGRKISDVLFSKALELQSKITGEMVERQKVEHTGKVDVSVAAQRQVDNLKKKIGLTLEEETDGEER